jgi:hypothetical protein
MRWKKMISDFWMYLVINIHRFLQRRYLLFSRSRNKSSCSVKTRACVSFCFLHRRLRPLNDSVHQAWVKARKKQLPAFIKIRAAVNCNENTRGRSFVCTEHLLTIDRVQYNVAPDLQVTTLTAVAPCVFMTHDASLWTPKSTLGIQKTETFLTSWGGLCSINLSGLLYVLADSVHGRIFFILWYVSCWI